MPASSVPNPDQRELVNRLPNLLQALVGAGDYWYIEQVCLGLTDRVQYLRDRDAHWAKRRDQNHAA